MIIGTKTAAAIGWCLVSLAPLVTSAADEPDDWAAERCVMHSRISRTDIVDEQTILFYMRDGTIYRNDLRRRCAGLRPNRTISYKTSLPQLCDLDFITVLYNQGTGFSPGATCSLGHFTPITEDEAVALKSGEPRDTEEPVEKKEVPSAEPEEIEKPE